MLSLVAGISAGVVRSLMGWAESEETFKPKMMLTTLIRTAILGGMIGYGLRQDPFNAFFQTYFADALINKSYKITKKS